MSVVDTSLNFKGPLLAATLAVTSTFSPAQSVPTPPAPKPAETPVLSPMTVSGTRTENKVEDAPATVSVISAKDVEERLAQDLRDLIRYEPNVSVGNNPARFGLTGINIRGIEGNRILMQVDGVRLPDSFSIGSLSFATRDSIDIDLLKSAEVLRGPGSSLYGSDALGGVVSFYTKDPSDLLRESGKLHAASIKQSTARVDRSTATTATLAATLVPTVQALLYVNRREGRETRNSADNATRGPSRTVPNPQRSASDGILAKLVWDGGTPLVRLTAERRDAGTNTDIASLNSLSPKTTVFLANDNAKRNRLSVDAEWEETRFADQFKVNAYRQESNTRQRTLDRREGTTAGCSGVTTGTNTCVRDVEFTFDQNIDGISAQAERRVDGRSWRHRIVWGFDYSKTSTAQLRDGTQTITTATGTVTTTQNVGADAFPVRDFPLSDTTQFGAYFQNEIQNRAGSLSLVPGIRFDRFKLNPSADSIFTADNPGVAVKALNDQAVSPRVGLLWKALPSLALYAQAARGFRAPPYNDVNLGFTNFAFGYTAIPNPDLKAEKSQGYELGLRGSAASYSWSITYFDNKYRDFIASLTQLTCPGDPRCSTLVPITFQSVNVGRVKIHGVEARGDVSLDVILRGLKAIASVGRTRGENQISGLPLDSVDPRKVVSGLKYDSPSRRFGVETIITAHGKQDRFSNPAQFVPNAASVVDLYGYLRIADSAQLTLGLLNATDRKYWLWSDVRGVTAASTSRDRFTQPGRHLSASLKIDF
jgi:hemoglobin/transferrin/lactoferrin receptor protein